MAFNEPEEIDDADADTKIDSEEEEDTEDDGDESEDSKADGEESEEGDDDESDSDDDDDKPLTRGELRKILAQRGKNRTHAAARASGKRDLTDTRRPSKDEDRLANIEKTQAQILVIEEKRQFGHENGLSPDEVDVVYRLVKKPRGKDLSDPVVKGALEGHRNAKKAKANVPSSQGRRATVTPKEDKNLTPEDRKSNFLSRRQEILAGKR